MPDLAVADVSAASAVEKPVAGARKVCRMRDDPRGRRDEEGRCAPGRRAHDEALASQEQAARPAVCCGPVDLQGAGRSARGILYSCCCCCIAGQRTVALMLLTTQFWLTSMPMDCKRRGGKEE